METPGTTGGRSGESRVTAVRQEVGRGTKRAVCSGEAGLAGWRGVFPARGEQKQLWQARWERWGGGERSRSGADTKQLSFPGRPSYRGHFQVLKTLTTDSNP